MNRAQRGHASDWHLHPQLADDTHPVASWPLCELRLMDDANHPWLILVPRVVDAVGRASLDAARHNDASFNASLLPQLSIRGNLPRYNRSIIPVVQPDGSTQFRALSQTTTDLSLTMSQQLPFTGGSVFVSSSRWIE